MLFKWKNDIWGLINNIYDNINAINIFGITIA